jgi:hypothetical protein
MPGQGNRFETCISFNNCHPESLLPKCFYGRLDDFNRNRLTPALKSFMLSNSFQLDPSRRKHVKEMDFVGLCSFIQQEPWSRRFSDSKAIRRPVSPGSAFPWEEAKMKSLKVTERLDYLTWEKKLGYLVSLVNKVSSNSDINIRKLCLYVALVMKLLKVLGRKDLFRELCLILHYHKLIGLTL